MVRSSGRVARSGQTTRRPARITRTRTHTVSANIPPVYPNTCPRVSTRRCSNAGKARIHLLLAFARRGTVRTLRSSRDDTLGKLCAVWCDRCRRIGQFVARKRRRCQSFWNLEL